MYYDWHYTCTFTSLENEFYSIKNIYLVFPSKRDYFRKLYAFLQVYLLIIFIKNLSNVYFLNARKLPNCELVIIWPLIIMIIASEELTCSFFLV